MHGPVRICAAADDADNDDDDDDDDEGEGHDSVDGDDYMRTKTPAISLG